MGTAAARIATVAAGAACLVAVRWVGTSARATPSLETDCEGTAQERLALEWVAVWTLTASAQCIAAVVVTPATQHQLARETECAVVGVAVLTAAEQLVTVRLRRVVGVQAMTVAVAVQLDTS